MLSQVRDDRFIALLAISVLAGTFALFAIDILTVLDYGKETESIQIVIHELETDDDGFLEISKSMAKNSELIPNFDEDLSKHLHDFMDVKIKDSNYKKPPKEGNFPPLNATAQKLYDKFNSEYENGIKKSESILNEIAGIEGVAYAFVIFIS